jgi:hypothetical protein
LANFIENIPDPERKFPTECQLRSDEFQPLLKSFMQVVDEAFQSHLNDHITGKNFVEYNSYYRHRG